MRWASFFFLICLLAIWSSSFVQCLFKPFAYFPIGYLSFLLISRRSLCILNINPVSITSFANYLSTVTCLYASFISLFLMSLLIEKFLILKWPNLLFLYKPIYFIFYLGTPSLLQCYDVMASYCLWKVS